MDKIEILSAQEAGKIAAGQVIDRPADIIKEIVENSIDAGANQIFLYLKKAGKDLIKIIDNGCGMSLQDAKLCFEPHATSKIKSLQDLQNIKTFGFRGEALASISAISKIYLKTRELENNLGSGSYLEYMDGEFVKEEQISCPVGTELNIVDLFYNTPVRKKFLRQDETELNQILSVFYAFCLSNLNIHFKIYNDDKLILNAPVVNSLKDRVTQIWGHNFASNFLELKDSGIDNKLNIKIYGLISNHNFYRYNRNSIYFFINNRYVKNRELSSAFLKGYLNVLPVGKFSAGFIFIKIDDLLIDINTHPKKEEIKFAKPVTVETYLKKLVTETLQGNVTKSLVTNNTNSFDFLNEPVIRQVFTQDINAEFKFELEVKKTDLPSESNKQIIKNYSKSKIIGQLLNTYILIEKEDGLLIIDQHAAHERILYEKYLKNFDKKDGTRLLFPEIINLNYDQIEKIIKEKDFFYKQGIEIDKFSETQIVIKTSPPKIQNSSLKELIFEIIAFIEENDSLDQEIFRKKLNDHMHAQLACKMAIKAGDKLSLEQMENIISELSVVDNRLICVHGRPTTWILTKDILEKNFKRK